MRSEYFDTDADWPAFFEWLMPFLLVALRADPAALCRQSADIASPHARAAVATRCRSEFPKISGAPAWTRPP